MTSSGRFYFVRDGRELCGHPLNGCPVSGCGPAVDRAAASRPDATAWDRRRTVVYTSRRGREIPITAADFGGVAVMVKEWWPEPSARSMFYLVPA